MSITPSHWLGGVPRYPTPDHGGALIRPRFVIVHYTAGGSADGAIRALTARDDRYVSAHLVIGRDGAVAQLASFRTVCWHAGRSAWRGIRGLNTRSIGIELVNPGWRRPGHEHPDWPTVRACHKNGGPMREWFLYTAEQYRALGHVLPALFEHYESLEEVVGHDDVSPGRKSDPGPALDWLRVRSALQMTTSKNASRRA